MRPRDLRFLTDENVSPSLVLFLREQGHDVLDVKEKGWHGKEDAFLLRKAAKARRFVISHDRDFGKLAINQRQVKAARDICAQAHHSQAYSSQISLSP